MIWRDHSSKKTFASLRRSLGGRRRTTAVLTAVALVASSLVIAPFAASPVGAAAADLDPTFGGGDGIVIEGFGADTIHAITQQTDGKLVAAGGYAKVARYNDDGSLDTRFAGDGVAELVPEGAALASGIALDGAGRVLISGSNTATDPVMVARLAADGTPDPTFGGDGVLEVQVGAGEAHLNAIAEQADGKIVVAGYARQEAGGSHYFAAARFNPDGSFDERFGTGGTVIVPANGTGIANDVAIQDDGRIVLSGYSIVGGAKRFTTVRLLSDAGALDTTFGATATAVGTGVVETSFDGESEARQVELQPDGKIVLGGTVTDTHFAFARLHADGTLDTRFNDGGRNVLRPANQLGALYGLDLDRNGKIVGNGPVQDPEFGANHAVVRLDGNGFVDAGFGVEGSKVVGFGSSAEARALVVQTDGKIVTAGSASSIARLLGDAPPTEIVATGRIAFSSNRSGNFDIWVADDGDATTAVNLTNTAADDYDPAISPDGSRIAFSTVPVGGRSTVWYMNADGSGLTQVPPAGWEADPEWSPDGTKIVYTRDFGGQNFELLVFDTTQPASDTNPTRLTFDAGYNDGFPNWSPDGSTIVFRSVDLMNDGEQLIRSVPAAGGEITSLVTVLREINTTPSWSPDGRRILFSSHRTGGGDIYVMHADGSGQTRVTSAAGREDLPEWSPDGIRIAFTRVFDDGTTGVVVADADGRNEVVFTAVGGRNSAPSWVGDGLTLTVTESTTTASPSHLALEDIVLSPNAPGDPEGLPLTDADLAGLPLTDADLAGLPLTDADLAGLPLTDADLAGLPAPVTWEVLLVGTKYEGVPLQHVRLIDVLALVDDLSAPQVTRDAIRELCVCDIDWSQSPLSTIGAVPLALGKTTFSEMTLPADDAGWCSRFEGLGFANCGEKFGGLGGTAFAFQLAGGHLAELPLNALPIGDVKLQKSALLGYSLTKIETAIGFDRSPLGSIPLSELPKVAEVADCTKIDCTTKTIADAGDGGALVADGEVRDLGTTSAEGIFTPIPRLAAFLLGDVVFSLLPISQTPIEDLSLDTLQLHRYGGPTARRLDYHLTYVHGKAAAVADAVASVELPGSFAYIPGTSTMTVVGGSTAGSRALPDPAVSGGTLSWNLGKTSIELGTSIRIDFGARPGLRLGTFTASALLAGTGLNESAAGQAAVEVGENFEGGETPAQLTRDTAYLNHISGAGDVDYFHYPVPTSADGTKALVGARVQFHVSHVTHDVDVVGYLPAGLTPAEPARTVVPRISLRGSPVVPPSLAPVPVADTAVTVDTGATKPAEQTVNDVPLRTDLAVGAISANHGLWDELIELVVPEGAKSGDQFVLQISGYNGSFSDKPAVFRVKEIGLPKLPPCSARATTASSVPSALALPAPSPITPITEATAGTQTLVFVSPARLHTAFGDAAAEILDAVKADSFLAHQNVQGQLINLDADQNVVEKFAAADADPCSISKANDVVTAINALIDSLLVDGENYNLRSVVIVGSDEVVPHHRIADTTRKFNERLYASSLAFTTRSGEDDPKSNALLSALAHGYVVSDSAYGDLAPYIFPGGFVSVPQLAVGRLVETPSEMAAQINRFVSFDGRLEPKSAAVAGYDFVKDNAVASDAALAAAGIGDRTLMANDTWTATDLVGALQTTDSTGTVARDIVNVNGHYNHYLQQPAAGSDLFATTSLDANEATLDDIPALTGAGIFTMSCHTALNVADVLIGNPTDAQKVKLHDWPQAYGAKGAAFLVGASGYGYGDRYTLGYGERVVTSFAAGLTPGASVAEAYVDAQQEYFASLGVNGVYDNKVLQETMLFGLPMFRINGAMAQEPATNAALAAPEPYSVAGLLSSELAHTPQLTEQPQSDGTSYFVDDAELPQITQDNPITARSDVDVTQPGLIASGAFVTETTYTARSGFRPSISRPTVDLAEREPPLQPDDVFFPANLQRVGTAYTSDGLDQQLVVMSTQFQGAGLNEAGQTVGNLKTYSSIKSRVFYVDPAATAEGDEAPTFSLLQADVLDNELNVTVKIGDSGAKPVEQVLVLYTEIADGLTQYTSRQLWLTYDAATDSWIGSAPVTTGHVEVLAQALNGRGLVGISINKTAVVGTMAPPIVSIATPASGAVYTVGEKVVADYTCVDAQTGHRTPTCEGSVADGSTIDTRTPGTKTFTVLAADANGTPATRTVHYSVQYAFEGFFEPIENLPTWNSAKAGQTIPVKWRLRDASGALFTTLEGKDVGIMFRQIPCNSSETVEVPDLLLVELAVTWDPVAEHYITVLKTPKDFASKCYELRVHFYADQASARTAIFEFK